VGRVDPAGARHAPGVREARDHQHATTRATSRQGDSVRINQIGDVTVKDYTKNADMNAPEALTDAQLVLKIDQAKYFNFQIDNIDRRQASV
jgi:hypothetical protein